MASKQEIVVRVWDLGPGEGIDLNEVRSTIQDCITATNLPLETGNSSTLGFNTVVISSSGNSQYMQLHNYLQQEGGSVLLVTSVTGKGQQVKANDLEKLYFKAAGVWSNFKYSMEKGKQVARFFGNKTRTAGIVGGIGAATGIALVGTFKLAAKGVRALMRDRSAYEAEMEFYTTALGLVDYIAGGVDNIDIFKCLEENACNNNAIAQYLIACAYAEGRGTEQNEEMAFSWFLRAAENGELRSQNVVAGEYLYNQDKEYTNEQKQLGIKYLYNLAESGEIWALPLLIDIFGRSSVPGINPDYDEAIRIAQIYENYDEVFSAVFLAPIYDSSIPEYDESLKVYKNDTLAFRSYQIILGSSDKYACEEAAMRLAYMCKEGRGTEPSTSEAVQYLIKAGSLGNQDAKLALIDAYSNGIGIEKSEKTASKYANELIRSGDPEYVPFAYYALFKIADGKEKFGESMKMARKYLSCDRTDPEISSYLKTYLENLENKISQMTDAERREFLKEPKLFDFKGNKTLWIVMISLAVIALIIGITMSKLNHKPGTISDLSKEQVENNNSNYSDDNPYHPGGYDGYEADFILPGSDERYIEKSVIESLDSDETQMAINEIYARHGRIFADEPYSSHFRSFEWYIPKYSAEQFDDNCFNQYERKNIEILAEHRSELSSKDVNDISLSWIINSEEDAIQCVKDYITESGMYDINDMTITCNDYYDGGYQVEGYFNNGEEDNIYWKVVKRGFIFDNTSGEWIYNEIEDLYLFDETEWEWSRGNESFLLTFHQDGDYSVSYYNNGQEIMDADAGRFIYKNGTLIMDGRFGPDIEVENEKYGTFSVNGFSGEDVNNYIVLYQ